MNYLYLEIPLPEPSEPERQEDDSEEWEFLVKDYLEDCIKYVDC